MVAGPRNERNTYVSGRSYGCGQLFKCSDCPKLSNKGKLPHSSPFLLNGDLFAGRPSQQALHKWPIGLALGQSRGIAIMVHCGGNVRVSHEFLLHAHGCSGFVQPGSVGVAERMEADPAKSQLETCRN